jgi:hypothetical protein
MLPVFQQVAVFLQLLRPPLEKPNPDPEKNFVAWETLKQG